MRTFWISMALIVLFFIPSYARTYFEHRHDMERWDEIRGYEERMERMTQEATENTKKTNAELLRLTREKYGMEKKI